MANVFEERIEAAISRNKHRDSKIPEGVHTIGEFISAIFSIDNQITAKAFYEGYLGYLEQQVDIGGTPDAIARSNIGWCFGEGMDSKRIKMWVEVCGASHPIFGTTVPSPKEAFSKGLEVGKGMR